MGLACVPLQRYCLWVVFREVRPSLGHTNQLQTKARAGRHWTGEWNHSLPPHWLLLTVRVKSAPSFMAQSLLHPGVPNHLASIPGPFLGAPEGGNSEQLLYHGGFLNAPSATPVCFNLFF
ncbi:hypothetical protein CgunFtcFv8_023466 [Champsocephalus gunnari]|uniref:Uncharacterized protein n=1 Tax=Champsocephalus gunnari TaxID=52237 RepID=A0AAN8DGC6_CHAGU|nr:hypothetical protein CgunFtcFv8_023466 [Champsocephalus gunnari]